MKLALLCLIFMAAAISARNVMRIRRVHSVYVNNYQIVDEKLKWNDAKAHCRKCGGFLVTINNVGEHNFLVNEIKKSKLSRVWIGLNDINKEGKFRWDKGNACCGYRAWINGEPNNSGGHEDCVELRAASGKLNDLPCSLKLPFICEINQAKTVLNQYH